jgi:hypothetical protein
MRQDRVSTWKKMTTWRITWAVALAAIFGFQAAAWGQSELDIPDEVRARMRAMMGGRGGGGDGDKKKDELPPFDEVMEDHKQVSDDGSFMELWYNKKDDHLFVVIPAKLLNQNFLMASSISGGPRFAGWQWGHGLVQWREIGDKLALIRPEVRFAEKKDNPINDVIERTYTDSIVLALPIKTKRGGDVVIDGDKFFKKDNARLSMAFGGSMDSSLSKYTAKPKAFPSNVEISVDAAMMNGQSGGTMARVHYSMSEIPKTDYKPREADPRIGYFMTAIKDWTKGHQDKTLFKRYIHRWNLQKADPSADLSDVKEPIVFYIEKTVPVKFRRYVREGIEEWNKAFEKAGLYNAIVARQQTDDNEFKDLDPEDVRYNFFRWIVSGRAFAMGPSRANPLTGEILDADIIFDDALVRSMAGQYARLSAKGPATTLDPLTTKFLERHPEWDFTPAYDRLAPGLNGVSGVDLEWEPEVMRVFEQQGDKMCTCALGMTHELAFGSAMLEGVGHPEFSDEFLGQILKFIVSHEVGHTLGLRHNFKASSWKSIDQILGSTDPNTPLCGSVMDYIAPLYPDKPTKDTIYVSPTIGPYDYWAIEYGYRIPTGKGEDDKNEEDMLKNIASRSADPSLTYGTDEDSGGVDPLIATWENTADPVAFAEHRFEIIQKLQSNISDWAVEDGESYNELRKSFDMLLFEMNRATGTAGRVVGGQYLTRDFKGSPDARPPITIVPAAEQRKAIKFLNENVFSDKAFEFDPELLNHLAAGRWGHWDSDAYDGQIEYPIHDRIAAIQSWALFELMSPFKMGRMYDAELKVVEGQDALTVPELLNSVTDSVWTELAAAPTGTYTTRKPYISSTRRNLQRRHLQNLTNLVLDRPGRMVPADVNAVARLTLRDLSEKIDKRLARGTNLDSFTQAHLTDAKAQIDKALAAEYRL